MWINEARYAHFWTKPHRGENKQFSTLRCTKTGSTQPKLSAACFAVQSYLAAADFVVFSNYCLIGTRQTSASFILREKAAYQTPQEHSTAHATPPVRQMRQAMTEPVQVDTAAQYGYKYPAIYSHFIVQFFSKNALIGCKCKKEAAPNLVLLPFCIYDNLLDCLRNIPLFNFRYAGLC